MENTLVSIIIPTYNSSQYIEETLQSVFSQTYVNWECIIIDDGSTDNSKEIALLYCKKDNRFKYYYQQNAGPSSARNYGLLLAKGDYIQFLDADDVLLPDRFSVLINEYKNIGSGVILYSDLWLGKHDNIYESSLMTRPASIGKDITFYEMYRYFADTFLFIPACVLFPVQSIMAKEWNTSLKNSEDWDFYLSVLHDKSYVLRIVPQKLVIYRNTPTGLSKNKTKTLEANYNILIKWNQGNTLTYIIKTAKNFSRNLFSRIFKNADRVIFPPINRHYFFKSGIVYFIVWFYLLREFIRLIIVKFKYHK